MSRIVWADGTVDEKPGIRADRFVVAKFHPPARINGEGKIERIMFQRSTLVYPPEVLGPFTPDTQRDPETGFRFEFVYREIV